MILNPDEIERESMRIIEILISGKYSGSSENLPVIKRVIHATADFDFLETLYFSENVISKAHDAILSGTPIITDTNMLKAGISKTFTQKFGINIICHVNEPETQESAQKLNLSRSIINIERAVKDFPRAIYAIGNAPTALIKLCELINEGLAYPALIIGVPVGFVNVIEAKEMLADLVNVPRIIANGRKGGISVACAIVNALLYSA